MSDANSPYFGSSYGHPLVRTPNMDRIAQQGAAIDARFCNAPHCGPSRRPFITGQLMSHCKGWENAKPVPLY